MKRVATYALCAVLCTVLFAGVAQGSTRGYSGTVTPAGNLSFKLKKKNGKRKVRSVKFDSVPVTCADGAHTTEGNITFSVPVGKQGGFSIVGSSSITGATVKVRGKVAGKSASGTIDLSGNVPIESGGDGDDCESGKLSWSAARN